MSGEPDQQMGEDFFVQASPFDLDQICWPRQANTHASSDVAEGHG